MHTRTDDWEQVWADYDARAGAPKWQPHTPWYMDPDYAMTHEPTPEATGGRGRPFMVLASMAVVFLAFMLNIRFVPEPVVQAAAPWQPIVAPVALVSFGAPAEAASTLPPAASPSAEFGDLMTLPPPDWVRGQPPAAAFDQAQAQAARDAALARPVSLTGARQASREARSRQPQALARAARFQHAQAGPRWVRPATPPPRLAAASPAADQLCAPAPQRQAAATPAARQDVAAAPAAAATLRLPVASAPGKVAAASRGPGQRPQGGLAMAGAPRAPPGGHARS